MFKNIITILIILLFTSCSVSDSEQDNSFDVKLIQSLKKSSTTESITAIDSILNTGTLTEKQEALLIFEKAKLLSDLQKDKEAIKYFKKALTYFKSHNNKAYIAEIYWQLGSEYAFISNKVEAVSYLLKAQELNKKIKDPRLEANIYIALAHVQFLYQDYLKAIEYTKKAIVIQEKEKDSLRLSATYNNLAVIYKNIGEFSNALHFNNKSLKLNKSLNDKSAIAKSYNNLGSVYKQIGQYDKAIAYYNKAIDINTKIGSANTKPNRNLADLFLYIHKIEPAKKIYLDVLRQLQKQNNIKVQKDVYDALLHIALLEKDFQNSLKYQQKRDSLNFLQKEKENLENLKLAESQYQLVAKENDLLKARNTNRTYRFILILTILSSLFLLIFWKIQSKNKKLKDDKEKMFLEQKVLRSQMNPHFIFNALSAIQNSLLDNEPLKSASYLSRFAKLIRQNFDFIDKKSISLSEEIDTLKNYLDTQKMRYEDKFDYEINIYDNVDIHTIEIPPLMLQAFVENAIEHGFKNIEKQGKINITIYKHQDAVCFEIKDNGTGFEKIEKDGKKHAIDIFLKRLKLRGLNEEKSFKISSNTNGTTVNFCLKC